MSMDKWATSTSTQLSTKVWVKLLLLLENALKLNLRPPNLLKIWILSRASHTFWPHHHRTGQKLCMDLSWYALTFLLQVKTLYHTEKQGFGYPGFQKNSRHTHQNRLKLSPVSEKSAYPLQNYICFSPFTSGLESFGHKSTPSDRPRIEA